MSSVSVTSSAHIVEQSFHAMMWREKSSSTVGKYILSYPKILEQVKSVYHILLGRVVLVWSASAALITMYVGLVIRSWAFKRR